VSDFRIYLSGSILLTRHLYVTEESRRKRGQLSDEEFKIRVDMANRTLDWNHFANHLDLVMSASWKNYAKKLPGSLSVDSGGFQISMGRTALDEINLDEIIERYLYYNFTEGKDFGFSLDRPIGDFDHREFEKYYNFNVGNIIKMKEKLGNTLIPVVHSCTTEHVKKVMDDIGYFPVYSFPSRFGTSVNVTERHMISLIRRIKYIRELAGENIKMFLLGGGGLNHSVITFLQGADWTDASSWIRSANRRGEIYGFDTSTFTVQGRIKTKTSSISNILTRKRAKRFYDEILSYDYILDNYDFPEWYETITEKCYYRSCHNAWAMRQLENKINELDSREEISQYYANIWKRNGSHKTWLKLLSMCDEKKKQKPSNIRRLIM